MKLHGDCPNCKEKVTFDLEKEIKIKQPQALENQSTEGQTQILEQKPPEIIEKEVIKTVIEDFKPNYECPDGNCDIGVHKNTNFKKRPKGKCSNCNQFTKHESGTCPWCKGMDIEALDPEELDELGIVKPPEIEEEHNHE